MHFVPIKHTFDDMFIAEVNKQLYAFTIKGARILRYKQALVRSFGVIQYDTTHFSSIKSEFKELEIILKENSLPKVNRELFGIFQVLSKREKGKFEEHDITKLIAEFKENFSKKYPERVEQIEKFLKELDTKKIVTPLKRVTDMLQEDFVATSPNFLASVIPYLKSVDMDIKKVNNTEIKGHKNLMKYILIALIGIIIIAAVFIAYDQGAFDGLFSLGNSLSNVGSSFQGLPSPTGGFSTPAKADPYSDENIMAKYTPEALKEAINTGTIEYNKLSQKMKDTVDNLVAVP